MTIDLSIRLNTGTFRLTGDSFSCSDFSASLQAEKLSGTPFSHYSLRIVFLKSVQLLRISWRFDISRWKETFLYQTFYNASAAVFQRNGKHGRCLGFANPFCHLDGNELYFEPCIRYESGEEYLCDDIFIGTYTLTGKIITPEFGVSELEINGRCHPRYRNPGEGIPLDAGEINAFNRYTAWYCEGVRGKFKFTSYNFFSNLPQRPDSPEMIDAYKTHLDACRELGIDTVILNPLCCNTVPNAEKTSIWEFFPPGTPAEELLLYARNRGLKIGIYSGTAGTGIMGNCPMIPYADIPVWKKIDGRGRRSSENCLGCDEFVQWFIQVQANTIQQYKLDLWNWDPGPGNAFFCFNPEHRHLPGRGAYLGFRNSLKVMKELREQFPGLYYQGFHGNKEYGVWGFKYMNQHEAYWENENYTMMPVFPDLSADRCTADGIRQQSAWNYFFRFLPASLNHGLAHRMVQACWMNLPDMNRLFDGNGWKYALLSAVAAGGAVTLPILPRNVGKNREYCSFYKKWVGFARKNFRLSERTIPFGAFPGCGIDGFAKILRNKGYLFFFNASPRPESINLKLDETIGFTTGKTVFLSQIYPYPMTAVQAETGKKRRFVLPAYGVRIFQVSLKQSGTAGKQRTLSSPLPRTIFPQVTAPGHAGAFFQAPQRIFDLLSGAALHMEEGFAEAAKAYQQKTGRNNILWARPDRLWLWIAFDNPHNRLFSLKLNGIEIPFEKEEYKFLNLSAEGFYFADITDHVRRNQKNVLETDYAQESGNLLFYLHYPQSEHESVPNDGELLKQQTLTHWRMPVRKAPRQAENISIIAAGLNADNIMRRNAENELMAVCNIPPEKLEGVYASVPISIGDTGNHLKHDMSLEWRDGAWRCRFNSGERLHLIVDDEKIVLWAVTRRNTESAGYVLPIQWEL